MISVLVSARKDSKYLSKFIEGLRRKTNNDSEIEVLFMINEHDTWNEDLIANIVADRIQLENDWRPNPLPMYFFYENLGLGRHGLHEYFNKLVPHTRGDWIIYFCDDHFIIEPDWNLRIEEYISGTLQSGDSSGKTFPLDPQQIWTIIPKFDNCGAMNHIVSKGFIKAMGGKIGRHGWIDSYLNDLFTNSNAAELKDRVIRMDLELFHDFTHDKPSPLEVPKTQAAPSAKGALLPAYDTALVRHRISMDQKLLKQVIIYKEGRS